MMRLFYWRLSEKKQFTSTICVTNKKKEYFYFTIVKQL